MSGSTWRIIRVLTCLVLYILFPKLLPAQQIVADINPEIALSYTIAPVGITVNSSVRAYLVNFATQQRISGEIIAGHGVADLTLNAAIYQNRLVSNTGEVSESAFFTGVLNHCYQTELAAHANAYDLHKGWVVGPVCAQPYEVPKPPPPPKENCPVLLDLQQDGFRLSGPDPAVHFDIDADGTPDEIAWTQAGGDDAFLCWDRNHNGVIDDGRELFGYATPLLSGRPAKVGYRALAELDGPELGGNQDGKVDAHDAMFGELCAWIDGNRDGISQADEIHALDEVGVAALGYDYKTIRVSDQYGNLFRYTSSVEMRSGPSTVMSWPTYDVIFAEP